MMHGRTQAFVLLAVVATAGALAGVVGDRLLSERRTAQPFGDAAMPPAGMGPWQWEPRPDARYAERLTESLSLTADQEDAIDAIVAEEQVRVQELTHQVQPRFRAIADDTRGRIEEVLTPPQRQRLRELREERMRAMAAARSAMRPGGMREFRDSIARERGSAPGRGRRGDPAPDAMSRERAGPMLEMRARRDSVLQELRALPPEVRDSILLEFRARQPAWWDSVMRERRHRPQRGADTLRTEP